MKKIFLVGLVILLMLAACGGDNSPPAEPAAQNSSANEAMVNEPANTESAEPAAPTEEVMAEEEGETAVAESEEPAAEETAAEETMAEEPAADDPYGGLALSGTDPDTGLEVNPPEILKGTEFIVRGKIISMNLTPQTAPEFLIESPDGTKFRVHSQGVADIYMLDGSQLKAFEYKLGMLAQATVFQDVNAGVTTVVESSDLVLINRGE